MFPENGTTTYTYNPDLSLASKVDNKGQKLTYDYDIYGRATGIHKYARRSPDEDVCEQIALQWDGFGSGPAVNPYSGPTMYGRLGSAVHGAPSCQAGQTVEAFGYDTAGRVIAKALQINFVNTGVYPPRGIVGPWMSRDIAYNRAGVSQYTDPSYSAGSFTDDTYANVTGATYTIGYDSLMRPVSLTDDQQQHTFVNSVNYNPASQITQISAPDYSTAYQYNERNQLVGIGSSTGFSETYAFSPTQNNGQILSQTDTRTGETVSYRYDALGRLANAAATASSVGAAWAMSFGYDGFGNRYSQNMTAGTGPSVNIGFDAKNHITYPAGYSYDGNGNLTSVPGASGPVQYDYDYDNRLKGYTYGIDGKRLVKVTPFESSRPGPEGTAGGVFRWAGWADSGHLRL